MGLYYRIVGPAMERFRRKRAERIRQAFPDIDGMTVLDLGGSLHFWQVVGSVVKPRKVSILNIADDRSANAKNLHGEIELYDGKTIPRDDGSVDLLICNSVIEHVPPAERDGLAREIRRVARNYVIQTPAYAFPLEPHFVM